MYLSTLQNNLLVLNYLTTHENRVLVNTILNLQIMRQIVNTCFYLLLLSAFIITISVSCITPSRLGISYKGEPIIIPTINISDNPNISLIVNSLTKKDSPEDKEILKSRLLTYLYRNNYLTEILKNNPDTKIEMQITPSQVTKRTYLLDGTFFYPGLGILWPITPWWGSVNLDANLIISIPNKSRKEFNFASNQSFSIISYPYYRTGKILTKKYSSLYANLFEQISVYKFNDSIPVPEKIKIYEKKNSLISQSLEKDTSSLKVSRNMKAVSTTNFAAKETQPIKKPEQNKPEFNPLIQSNCIRSSSVSFGLAGHDLLDAWMRFRVNDKNLMMAGFGYKVVFFDRNLARSPAYTASAGYTHYFQKFSRINKKSKEVMLCNGVYFLGGYSFGTTLDPFGELSQVYLSSGGNLELFLGQKKSQSISLLIGPSISWVNSDADFYFNHKDGRKTKSLSSIYISIQYNLFFKSNK